MNKFFITLFSLLLIVLNSSAQKGNFIIGASSDVGGKSIIFWSLTPTAGYFVTDNLCVGLGFGMASASSDPGDSSFEEDTLSFSPFIRYYMNDNPLFFHSGMSLGSDKYKYTEIISADNELKSIVNNVLEKVTDNEEDFFSNKSIANTFSHLRPNWNIL